MSCNFYAIAFQNKRKNLYALKISGKNMSFFAHFALSFSHVGTFQKRKSTIQNFHFLWMKIFILVICTANILYIFKDY